MWDVSLYFGGGKKGMGQNGAGSHERFMEEVTGIYFGRESPVARLDRKLTIAVINCRQLTKEQTAKLVEALENHNPGECDKCCPPWFTWSGRRGTF